MTPDLSAVPWIPEYRLKLDVDFTGLTWTGTVEFDLPAGPNDLVLDSDGLEVTAVRKNGGTAPFLVRIDACELVLSGPHPAPVAIAIDFSGRVAEDALIGLYRSRNGSAQVLTSQCEPVGARKIFPCLDRPDRKARIRLNVSVDADLEVVANTPAEAVTEGGGRREWTFPATPPMATYLFYLGVGRFGHWEDRSGRVPVRVFTPVGRDAAGEFAAKAAARILAGYERYYGIPYPLPKLDLIAVAEHAFGAMENWGAISFNEIRLLIDTTSASFQRRDVFETISHEIAHQWFGDLVTMRWWDDVWLNESFASFLETKVTDEIDPSLDAPTDFVLRTAGMAAALDGDSLGVTHPVRAKVARPEEISQVFDEISYGKGSSVLRMLETYLGEEVFRRGVGEYLERFRYGNARTEDLWEALERAAAVPVSPIVGPWIDRPGLPVVSARLGPSGLELAQARFAYAGTVEEPPWPIPMTFERDGRRDRLLFDSRTRTLPCPPGATVHLNPGALGFYRTLYDADLFDRLLAALPSRPPSDRWIVLNDLAAFVLSGQADWPTYARAVRALGTTSDRLVVEEIVGSLAGWALAFPSVATVQDLARSYLAELVERVGLDRPPAESPATGILRNARPTPGPRSTPGSPATSPNGSSAGRGSTPTCDRPSRSPGRARRGRSVDARSSPRSARDLPRPTRSGSSARSPGAASRRSSPKRSRPRSRRGSTAATSQRSWSRPPRTRSDVRSSSPGSRSTCPNSPRRSAARDSSRSSSSTRSRSPASAGSTKRAGSSPTIRTPRARAVSRRDSNASTCSRRSAGGWRASYRRRLGRGATGSSDQMYQVPRAWLSRRPPASKRFPSAKAMWRPRRRTSPRALRTSPSRAARRNST